MLEQTSSRLLVISNRLPVTLTRTSDPDDPYAYSMSSGGLVAALSGLKKTHSFIWIGWPGSEMPKQDQAIVTKRLLDDHSCFPVFLPDNLADLYYNGFSNSILWPLFHYLPGDMNFDVSLWKAYQRANEAFAEALFEIIQTGDLLWIQDYHLFLLPSMIRAILRDKKPDVHVRIGFFLHTPFPSSEIYRVLPVCREVLHGVLQSDLIGFHTDDYVRHFLSSCTRLLGLETTSSTVEVSGGGHTVQVGAFPIGIDPEQFDDGLKQPAILEKIQKLKERFSGTKILLGVDRLDYIKGVPQKLHAFELFLSKHSEFQEKVILLQVAVPSRVDVEEYQQLTAAVNELVGRINGKYGKLEYMPIHFVNKSVKFDELVALYAASDVCVVSSTRDGMNLVSHEYIACQQGRHGVLILSEFAGAAQALSEAIAVNPWNTDELAEAYFKALTMSAEERAAKYESLHNHVIKHTAVYWGISFVSELKRLDGPK